MVCVMAASPPIARRRRWIASPRADVALALLVGVVSLQSAREPAWPDVAMIELAALPLAVRRSWPIPVLAITLGAAIVGDLLFGAFQIAGPVIALLWGFHLTGVELRGAPPWPPRPAPL